MFDVKKYYFQKFTKISDTGRHFQINNQPLKTSQTIRNKTILDLGKIVRNMTSGDFLVFPTTTTDNWGISYQDNYLQEEQAKIFPRK